MVFGKLLRNCDAAYGWHNTCTPCHWKYHSSVPASAGTWKNLVASSVCFFCCLVSYHHFERASVPRLLTACCRSYSIITAMGLPGGILMTVGMSIPFYLFIGLNLTLFFRGKKKNWICLIYWISNLGWLLLITTVMSDTDSIGSAIMGAFYGISLFVVWWLKPDFYYRWDQGTRQKVKEI